MPDGTLHLNTCRTAEGLRIALSGELDVNTVEDLPEPADLLSGEGLSAVMLDLRSLRYLDSTGLRQILLLQRAAEARHIALTAEVCEGSLVQKVLRLIGGGTVFPVVTAPPDSGPA